MPADFNRFNRRELLLDVTRLVWRVWRGGLPTGIDRVCLAYMDHFGDRSRAVVQRRGFQVVLGRAASQRLFRILREGGASARRKLAAFALGAWPAALMGKVREGAVYLNVGHTGLNEPALPAWIERHRLRAVYLVHDLIPITHPEFCREGEAEKHRQRMRNVLVSAAGVIGNSQATLEDLAAFARAEGLPMPATIAAWISGNPVKPGQPRSKADKPYFVTLGTIEGRKNHLLLLQVWRALAAQLGEDAPTLFIVGRRGWRADEVFAQLDELGELQGRVRELASVGDRQLAELVAGAQALLMPSFAEGFGLPVIGALELGTPVIAADLPVYRELVGAIPLYLDPRDSAAWEEAIQGYLTDGPERQRQIDLAKGYRAPDWPTHFDVVENWLASAIEKSVRHSGQQLV